MTRPGAAAPFHAGSGADAARWAEPVPPSLLLLSWHGRVARGTWWLFGAALPLAILVVGSALLQIAGHRPDSPWLAVVRLGALLPMLAVTAKRWHDLDRRAWWLLLLAVPFVGHLWTALECGLRRGQAGPNRFGPAPPSA